MERIKIAIIDSGINIDDSYFSNYIIGEKSFVSATCMDDNGHGSLCASTILKECKNVYFYIEKILDKKNISSLDVLEQSLINLLDIDVDIISLSLTVLTLEHEKKLKDICHALEKQGKIIIASLSNGDKKSYPAYYSSVIGVQGFILENEKSYWYKSNKRVQAVVDNNPYLHRNNNFEYELWGKCNSFSTAKLAGIISSIMYKFNIKEKHIIETILEKQAHKNNWSKRQLLKSKRFPIFYPQKKYDDLLLNQIIDIVCDYLKITDKNILYQYGLFDYHIGLTYKNAYNLLKILEKNFCLQISNYFDISRYDFYSLYCLNNLIETNLYAN